MKRFFLLVVLISLGFSSFSQKAWTVKTVPNTRLESNDIHVSDPDGYLSDEAEQRINALLCTIRDTADVFVVTLASVGNEEPKHFATELFNYWGIGDAATNNGVLLLFIEDQRALEFETGYGAELALTDARCEKIFTHTILPYFKAEDYENGLLAGVDAIVEVFQGSYQEPSNLMSTSGRSESGSGDEMSPWLTWLIVIIFVAIIVYAMFSKGGGSSSGSSSSSSGGWSSRSSGHSGGSFGGGHSGGGGYSGRW